MIKLIAKKQFNGIKNMNGVIAKGFSSSIHVPSIDEVGKYIQSNQYNGNYRPTFNYAGVAELVYDAHLVALKPRGQRLMSSLIALSYYGNYYYYALLAPFNQTYFALTCVSSLLLTMMQVNSSLSSQLTVIEMMVLPTRDAVRFVTMSGSIIETLIKDVTLEKHDNNKITMMTKPTNNKNYRILINLDQKFIKSEYINTELIMAIAHPECHKI